MCGGGGVCRSVVAECVVMVCVCVCVVCVVVVV